MYSKNGASQDMSTYTALHDGFLKLKISFEEKSRKQTQKYQTCFLCFCVFWTPLGKGLQRGARARGTIIFIPVADELLFSRELCLALPFFLLLTFPQSSLVAPHRHGPLLHHRPRRQQRDRARQGPRPLRGGPPHAPDRQLHRPHPRVNNKENIIYQRGKIFLVSKNNHLKSRIRWTWSLTGKTD